MPEHQQIHQSKKPDTIFQKQTTSTKQIPLSNPISIIQRAKINPKSLTYADVMQLQRTIGNRAVGMLLTGIGNTSTVQQATVQRQEISEEETCPSCMQRQEIPEEEEPLQGKMIETIQRQEIPEEEEPLQGKIVDTIQRQEIPEEEEPLQGKMSETVQRQEIPEEEEPLQGKMAETVQRQEIPAEEEPLQGKMIGTIQRQEIPEEEEPLQGKMIETIQQQEIPEEEEPLQTKRENNTGMTGNLKAGVENLSGIDMSDVRVHYNSDKPAEVGALAYTQGTNIHVAPGQERHLPHEAWHVVQQMQSRVKPTMQAKGVSINDDAALEREADVMGGKALQMTRSDQVATNSSFHESSITSAGGLNKNAGTSLEAQTSSVEGPLNCLFPEVPSAISAPIRVSGGVMLTPPTVIQRQNWTTKDVPVGPEKWTKFREDLKKNHGTMDDDAVVKFALTLQRLWKDDRDFYGPILELVGKASKMDETFIQSIEDGKTIGDTKWGGIVQAIPLTLNGESGSAPAKNLSSDFDKVNERRGGVYVLAHLINDNLHGKGNVSWNLTPAHGKTNTAMAAGVEKKIKNAMFYGQKLAMTTIITYDDHTKREEEATAARSEQENAEGNLALEKAWEAEAEVRELEAKFATNIAVEANDYETGEEVAADNYDTVLAPVNEEPQVKRRKR